MPLFSSIKRHKFVCLRGIVGTHSFTTLLAYNPLFCQTVVWKNRGLQSFLEALKHMNQTYFSHWSYLIPYINTERSRTRCSCLRLLSQSLNTTRNCGNQSEQWERLFQLLKSYIIFKIISRSRPSIVFL